MSYQHIHIEGVIFQINQEYGALIVHAASFMQGYQVYVYGENESSLDAATAYIQKKKMDGKDVYVAVFPRLAPKNYIVHQAMTYKSVTVFPGYVAEVRI